MEPAKELIDAVDRDRIERARRMSMEEKLLLGPRLFESICRRMTDGIRDEYPDATEDEVRRLLKRRLAVARRLEQPG